jgi:hypothetical protein
LDFCLGDIMKNKFFYNTIMYKLRRFFQEEKKFIEVFPQERLSILAACEDPSNITTFNLQKTSYPLPQTGQMWLEYELLNNPEVPGFFCLTTSYRDERSIIAGRHQRVFSLFEFESHGTIDDLRILERELLEYLGFEQPFSITYEALCARYGTQEISSNHEIQACKELGNILSLEKFPGRTSPFWNMKQVEQNLFHKIDVVMYGMETIGSAERSTDVDQMRHNFFTVSNGIYAQLLFEEFGEKRVMEELDDYLALPMFTRFGGGIGIMRLENAMKCAGLLDVLPQYIYQGSKELGLIV